MSDFTDEQIRHVIAVYESEKRTYRSPIARQEMAEDLEDHMTRYPEWHVDSIAAMRAALHTLGPIEIHTPEKDGDNLYCTICRAPEDSHWAHEWPCPTAQAHEKETNA